MQEYLLVRGCSRVYLAEYYRTEYKQQSEPDVSLKFTRMDEICCHTSTKLDN